MSFEKEEKLSQVVVPTSFLLLIHLNGSGSSFPFDAGMSFLLKTACTGEQRNTKPFGSTRNPHAGFETTLGT